MCLIITQIMEVEEKLSTAQTEGERQILRHEIERLEADYDAKYNGNTEREDLGDVHALGKFITENWKHH